MKFFERACLRLFSIIIFILALVVILITLNVTENTIFADVLENLTTDTTLLKVTIVTSVILLFVSAKFILFGTKKEEFAKEGIILENPNGKLVISKESLENMILSSAKSIDGLEYVNSKTLIDKEHKLIVYVTVVVKENAIVKEVSKQLQNTIKDTMKNTADLEVSSVSITVKNIVNKKGKTEKVGSKQEEIVKQEEVEEENI